MGFEFGEGFLDWIEVRAVGWEIAHGRSRSFDGGLHAGAFVRAEIFHDDNVVWPQIGYQHAVDVGLEATAIERTVQHHGSHDTAQPQPGDERRRLPVTVWHGGTQSLAAPTPPVASCHIGGSPGFINEDQPCQIEIEIGLGIEPVLSSCQDVRPLLFRRVSGLFSM
ncbi:hypothetical protein AD949_06695 [Acetobacter orleanensis]|nr:hypothetical protein AD949_06695 [Acetobacter orleanensis]